MPKLTINGMEVEVPPGTSILQAAEQLGIEIPRFCYHDKLSVPANCRMCLVEVEGGPPKPVASCAMACADEMVVKTDTEMVKKARNGVMEFLLINHPLDCPICDQGGECDLQDQAMAYGFDRSRYEENKRAVTNKNIGPLIKTIMTRCIQCTRCVRFGEEIAGVTELGLLNRGEDVEIDTFIEKAVSTELSGNMIDICPVGALTSKPYAFKARSWELRKTKTIDVHDAVGSNIRVDARGNEVMRVLPVLNEDINEEWIHDKTRFAYDGLKYRRLDRPWVRDDNGTLQEANWPEALSVVAEKLSVTKPAKTAAIAGELCDVESMVALKDLVNDLGVKNIDCRTDGMKITTESRSSYIFNTSIAGIEEADAILLVGTNPRYEASLINARIRKAWLHKRTPVALIGAEADLTYPYDHIGIGPEDLKALLKGTGDFAKTLKEAEKPMIVLGSSALCREDGGAIQALAADVADKYGMVSEDWNGFNILHGAASRVGALDIEFLPEKPFSLADMDLVYLLGADDFDLSIIPDSAFVIYQGHHGDAGAHRADVILPGAAYTEKDGLYVNTEGRVQKAVRAVSPPGEAREDWKILRALSETLDKPLPYNTHLELHQRIMKEWPHFGRQDSAPSEKWRGITSKNNVIKDGFNPYSQIFYLTNSIARASKTMEKCVKALGSEETRKQDQLEAAE